MPQPTLEQQRAKFALEKVREKIQDHGKKDYLIQLRRLPAQLHWGGLGQTVASLRADKNNDVRQQICGWIEAWLRLRTVYPSQHSLIDCITGMKGTMAGDEVQERYVMATHEARAVAVWLKKFAEAFLDEPKPAKKGEAMSLPLPKRQAELLLRSAPNLSLRFDHGYGGYDTTWRHTAANKKKGITEGKTEFLRDFVAGFNDPGVEYASFLDRRRKALTDAICVPVTSSAPLLVGLGRWNPTEIGFTLDRFTGCPYIPGSSVKGLLREAARLVAKGELESDKGHAAYWTANLHRIFGRGPGEHAAGDGEMEAGGICFFDAYPAKWPRLELDVLTPHQGDYYTGTPGTLPADWHDPVPVHFLRVAAGTEIAMCFAPRSGGAFAQGDGDEIKWLVAIALDWLGIGAKTASGYGWFLSPSTAELLDAGHVAHAEPSRKVPPKTEAPAPPKRMEWPGALLTWIAGSSTLRADKGSEYAETRDKNVIAMVPARELEQLKARRHRPIAADVVVERFGNAWRLVGVRAPKSP